MRTKPHNGVLAGSLLLAVVLFGANNTGIKFLVISWPPLTVSALRAALAGLVMVMMLRWTKIFGETHPLTRPVKMRLWWGSGLCLLLYGIFFTNALRLTSVSHVALYLGTPPVWALLLEGPPTKHWRSVQRYGAAALAFCGVLVLFWPILRTGSARLSGEILGLLASIVWAFFGQQCHILGRDLSGAEVSAHTFWRAAVLFSPFALYQAGTWPFPFRWNLIFVLIFCAVGGAVAPFILWNNALRHWRTSQVYLFNNLVPLSFMTWAHFCLGESFTRTFWVAMILIGSGVLAGQVNLPKIFGERWLPAE